MRQSAAAQDHGMVDTSQCERVKCDCGMEYITRLVPLGPRLIRINPLCPTCTARRNRRHADSAPAAAQAVSMIDAEWRKICPQRYRETVAMHLPCGQAIVGRLEEWRPKDDGNGLLLIGNTRRGKTRTAWLVLRCLLRDGYKVAFVDDPTLSVRYSDALGRGEGMDFVERMTFPPILFWDDFGKAAATPRYAELAHMIVEHRYAYSRPMIITSQLDSKALVQRLGVDNGLAIAERLRECCEVVTL
jgi:hypothetical protein